MDTHNKDPPPPTHTHTHCRAPHAGPPLQLDPPTPLSWATGLQQRILLHGYCSSGRHATGHSNGCHSNDCHFSGCHANGHPNGCHSNVCHFSGCHATGITSMHITPMDVAPVARHLSRGRAYLLCPPKYPSLGCPPSWQLATQCM